MRKSSRRDATSCDTSRRVATIFSFIFATHGTISTNYSNLRTIEFVAWRTIERVTRNIKYGTQSELGTRNIEWGTRNVEWVMRNIEWSTRNIEWGTRNIEWGTRNIELGM